MHFASAALVLAVAGLAAGQERQTVPSFPSQVDLVTVDVVVVDRQGKPVRGLTREDFTLFEDGKPQEIASFEVFEGGAEEEKTADPSGGKVGPAPGGRGGARTFVLLVDDLSLAPWRGEAVREALRRFLDEGLRTGDELIFATTSGDAWWSAQMPEGREDLLALVGRIHGRSLSDEARDAISDWEAFRMTHFEGPGGQASLQGGAPTAAGPPTAPAPPTPGTDVTGRVVRRYYERRVCNPDPPATPLEQCTAMVVGKAQMVDHRRTTRTRDILASVDRAVFALTGAPGRKSLLLLTEGFLNDPDVRGVQEVASRSREGNVAVYSLDARGLIAGAPGTSAADWGAVNAAEMGQMRMEFVEGQAAGNVGLAEDTGGIAIRNTNDIGGGAVQIADESRVYYLLGYAPPGGKGPRDWRKLRVEVSRPGTRVRARKGYTLRTPAEIAAAGAPSRATGEGTRGSGNDAKSTRPAAVPTDVTRALLAPEAGGDIPLRARAYALDERPGGLVAIALAVEADLAGLANLGGEDRPRGALTLSIAATHRDSGRAKRIDQMVQVDAGLGQSWEGWLALSRELELPPGVVQARVVVRDEFLGRLGSATVRFEVPATSGLRLSSPILADRLRPTAAGTTSMPALLARREFAVGSRLYCLFQVFGAGLAGAGPAVVGSYVVRRPNGATLQEGPSTPIAPSPEGRLVRLLRLPLEGLAPGAYELVVKVEDKASGRMVEGVERFWLRAPGS